MENFLNRLIALSFFSIVICSSCLSQTRDCKLSGVVLDSETGQPIQYATVFIAFSSKGCLTNEKGEFIITNAAEGKYEVVCAAVGYEKITTNHTLKTGTEINVTYKLKPVPIQVNEINVTASMPEDWEDNLLKFTKEFLGESSIARQCIISNPEVIDFEIKENKLFASSKKPLYIVNKSLGYNVTVYIKHFEWDVDYDEGKFAYEPFFENMTSLDSTQVIRWNENRKAAYLGSFIHFLRSCASNTGFDEGFRISVTENANQGISILKNIRTPSETTLLDWGAKESFDNSLMKIFKRYSKDVFVLETFDNISVIFKNNSEDPNYKWYKNRVFGLRDTKTFQSSILNLVMGRLTFNKEGNILDRTMFNTTFSGYWAWKRVGDLLPTDYEPIQ